MSSDHAKQQQALQEFQQKNPKVDAPLLDQIIAGLAETGYNCYNWAALRELLLFKIAQTCEKFNGSRIFVEGTKDVHLARVIEQLTRFQEAPFTIQRICELLHEPEKYYKHLERVLIAIDKCLTVTITSPVVVLDQGNSDMQQQVLLSDDVVLQQQQVEDNMEIEN